MVEEQNDTSQTQQSQTVASQTQEAGGQQSSNKSSIGLEPNLAALLSYLIPVVGLVFFFIEKENKYIRFHSLQSVLFCAALFVVNIGLTVIAFVPGIGPIIGLLGSLVIGLGGFVFWIILMIKAYQGENYKIPVIGDIAEQNA
jgi:uncharacterized membrane protein